MYIVQVDLSLVDYCLGNYKVTEGLGLGRKSHANGNTDTSIPHDLKKLRALVHLKLHNRNQSL